MKLTQEQKKRIREELTNPGDTIRGKVYADLYNWIGCYQQSDKARRECYRLCKNLKVNPGRYRLYDENGLTFFSFNEEVVNLQEFVADVVLRGYGYNPVSSREMYNVIDSSINWYLDRMEDFNEVI